MVAADLHPLQQVETMGGIPLDPGVQVQLIATRLLGPLDQPLQHALPETLRSNRRVGDQIVDVQVMSPGEIVRHPETRHGPHLAVVRQV